MYKLALAGSQIHLGDLARYGGRFEAAKTSYQAALAVLGPLDLDQFTSLATSGTSSPGARCGLGEAYLATGRLKDAETILRAALDGDASESEADIATAMERAFLCFNLGRLAGEAGRADDAIDWLSKGIALAEGVRSREPQHIWAITLLFDVYSCRGKGLEQLGRLAEALSDYDRALELPRDADQGVQTRLYRAAVLARLRRHDQAIEVADALAGDRLDPGSTRYNCACVYSFAATAAQGDTGLPPPTRAARAEKYAAQAVVLLKRAHAVGFFQDASAAPPASKSDPDLNPLRARADFQALLLDVVFPADPFTQQQHPAGTAAPRMIHDVRSGECPGSCEGLRGAAPRLSSARLLGPDRCPHSYPPSHAGEGRSRAGA